MHSELTAKEMAAIEYEKEVLKASKQNALMHVADVLAAAEAMLRMARKDVAPDHDGKVATPSGLLQGRAIAMASLNQLPESIQVRSLDCVTISDKCGSVAEHDMTRLAAKVDEYVRDVLFQLSLYRRFDLGNKTE